MRRQTLRQWRERPRNGIECRIYCRMEHRIEYRINTCPKSPYKGGNLRELPRTRTAKYVRGWPVTNVQGQPYTYKDGHTPTTCPGAAASYLRRVAAAYYAYYLRRGGRLLPWQGRGRLLRLLPLQGRPPTTFAGTPAYLVG